MRRQLPLNPASADNTAALSASAPAAIGTYCSPLENLAQSSSDTLRVENSASAALAILRNPSASMSSNDMPMIRQLGMKPALAR